MNQARVRTVKPDRDEVPPGWKTVLVPVDFKGGSERAVNFAAAVTQCNHGRIVLLHVVAPPRGREESEFCFLDEAERNALARLRRWAAERGLSAACDTELSVRAGASREVTILFEARRAGADLIVLGEGLGIEFGGNSAWADSWKTRPGAPRWSKEILAHASCPIVIVPRSSGEEVRFQPDGLRDSSPRTEHGSSKRG